MTLLLANWFKREELATRISYLFIASALSGAFGGLIAFGILYMDGTAGYPGWRWYVPSHEGYVKQLLIETRLYILEGLITIVFAGCCVWLVPKNYETAYFLDDEDKAIMKHRAEVAEAYSGGQGHYKMADIKLAAKDPKTWLHGLIQICVVTILYGNSSHTHSGMLDTTDTAIGFGTFLPIILKNSFHYTTKQAQYLVIPGKPRTKVSDWLHC